MENPKASPGRFAHRIWLVVSVAAILGSLMVLAIYVSEYDDNGLTERLRAIGRFTRGAMRVVSFPLGLPFGALANGPLESMFGCGEPNEPCGVFVDWWTHFVAVLAQVILLRWFVGRWS